MFSKPIFIEGLRESIGLHTCDRRRDKQYLQDTYPGYNFQCGFTNEDRLWRPVYQETPEQQALRLRPVLDSWWENDPSTYISATSHSGTITAILENVGHRVFNVQTGGMIPVVVRGYYDAPTITTTAHLTSATAPTCTENPSIIPTANPWRGSIEQRS
jgi:hypothetical protein